MVLPSRGRHVAVTWPWCCRHGAVTWPSQVHELHLLTPSHTFSHLLTPSLTFSHLPSPSLPSRKQVVLANRALQYNTPEGALMPKSLDEARGQVPVLHGCTL